MVISWLLRKVKPLNSKRKACLELVFKKGVSIYDARYAMYEAMEEGVQKELGMAIKFDRASAMFSFEAKCGCESITMKASEIPLEDLSCPCGKTKFIRIVWLKD